MSLRKRGSTWWVDFVAQARRTDGIAIPFRVLLEGAQHKVGKGD